MHIAYFDCFAGASGDMILGALLDAGLPLEALRQELAKLPVGGYQLVTEKVRRGGLSGTHLDIVLEREPKPLSPGEIINLISSSSLSPHLRQQGEAIFQRLIEAEAKVHGQLPEQVHFHEIGGLDALLDIMGAIIGLHLLGIEEVFASPLPGGAGTVATSQGVLPIPAPATLELIARAQAPVRPTADPGRGEVLTPTGAAILTTLASFETPTLYVEQVGYGAGSRDLKSIPNLLRVWIGQKAAEAKGELLLLETNIDDMNPEFYGYVMERLFEKGARDVWFTPIQMKKNRPGVMLSVLVAPEQEAVVAETIFRETSTLGIRTQPVQRHEVERKVFPFTSSLGPAAAKVKRLRDGLLALAPEYEVCRALAQKHGLPLPEVYRILQAEARERFLKEGKGTE